MCGGGGGVEGGGDGSKLCGAVEEENDSDLFLFASRFDLFLVWAFCSNCLGKRPLYDNVDTRKCTCKLDYNGISISIIIKLAIPIISQLPLWRKPIYVM